MDLRFSRQEDAGLEQCDVVFFATPHGVACLDQQLGHPSGHRGGQAAGTRVIAFPRGQPVDFGKPPVFPVQKYNGFIAVNEHASAAANTVERNR